MKKLLIATIVMVAFAACRAPRVPQQIEGKTSIIAVPFNEKVLRLGTREIPGPIAETELVGATVSVVAGGAEYLPLAPEAVIDTMVEHRDGIIVRSVIIDGPNVVRIPLKKKGGEIISVRYNGWGSPSSVVVRFPTEGGNTVNLVFTVDQKRGVYSLVLGAPIQLGDGTVIYECIDPVSETKYYVPMRVVMLGSVFLDHKVEDRRVIEEGGVPLPR